MRVKGESNPQVLNFAIRMMHENWSSSGGNLYSHKDLNTPMMRVLQSSSFSLSESFISSHTIYVFFKSNFDF